MNGLERSLGKVSVVLYRWRRWPRANVCLWWASGVLGRILAMGRLRKVGGRVLAAQYRLQERRITVF